MYHINNVELMELIELITAKKKHDKNNNFNR